MGIEFMVAANAFATLKILWVGLIVLLVYLSYRSYMQETSKYKAYLSFVGIIFFLGLTVGTVSAPKLKIETGLNYELKQYQEQTERPVINPVEPRTEKLEGFTPLKD